jgi:hypothetical protein
VSKAFTKEDTAVDPVIVRHRPTFPEGTPNYVTPRGLEALRTEFTRRSLLVWLVVEIAVVGYSNDPPLQALYFGLGIAIALVGVGWTRQTGFGLMMRAAFPEARPPAGDG